MTGFQRQKTKGKRNLISKYTAAHTLLSNAVIIHENIKCFIKKM